MFFSHTFFAQTLNCRWPVPLRATRLDWLPLSPNVDANRPSSWPAVHTEAQCWAQKWVWDLPGLSELLCALSRKPAPGRKSGLAAGLRAPGPDLSSDGPCSGEPASCRRVLGSSLVERRCVLPSILEQAAGLSACGLQESRQPESAMSSGGPSPTSGPSHLCLSARVCGVRSLVLQGAASLTRETKVRNRDTVSHLRQKLTVGTQTWRHSPVGAAEIEKPPWRAWASLAVRLSVQISFILPETWSTDLSIFELKENLFTQTANM